MAAYGEGHVILHYGNRAKAVQSHGQGLGGGLGSSPNDVAIARGGSHAAARKSAGKFPEGREHEGSSSRGTQGGNQSMASPNAAIVGGSVIDTCREECHRGQILLAQDGATTQGQANAKRKRGGQS